MVRQINLNSHQDVFSVLMSSEQKQINKKENVSEEIMEIESSRPLRPEVSQPAVESIGKVSRRPSHYQKFTPDEKREFLARSKSPNTKGVSATNLVYQRILVRKQKNGRKVKFPELDEHLKTWFKKLREAVDVKLKNLKKLEGIALSNGEKNEDARPLPWRTICLDPKGAYFYEF